MAPILNLTNPQCIVKSSDGKGRGVFAAHAIPSQTTVESSPVLLFGKEEYEQHGRFTILDHYTFKWPNGRMALALGLGSLFNHSNTPNANDLIHYTTTRPVEPGEELCIYYGSTLWFDLADPAVASDTPDELERRVGRPVLFPVPPFFRGAVDDILPEEELPFERFKPPPEEETADSIRTIQAWAVDVPDPRSIGLMLKWLRRSDLDASELGHLKRVRKQNDTSTFLLSVSTSPSPSSEPPSLPADIPLPAPYLLPVPASAALTLTSLDLKNALWPTVYAPRRKGEVEPWTRGRARWAWGAMRAAVREAQQRGRDAGELPVAAYVPAPYQSDADLASGADAFMAHDTRRSAVHPLRHAVMNVIRQIADARARIGDAAEPPTHTSTPGAEEANDSAPPLNSNGTNYLLTARTLFTTHEPCIMCSMALLHSRVKEVVYLLPMRATGGCGGGTCVPALPGVNHRFGICRWTGDAVLEAEAGLQVDASVDA
ncbi:hypothetical protein B0H14DRAFT_3108151 [Mycena olivaceomarginata]|nr:hypothetical protein B0H14DRAFT_3108151 [Mycena olivaceomarginata]